MLLTISFTTGDLRVFVQVCSKEGATSPESVEPGQKCVPDVHAEFHATVHGFCNNYRESVNPELPLVMMKRRTKRMRFTQRLFQSGALRRKAHKRE